MRKLKRGQESTNPNPLTHISTEQFTFYLFYKSASMKDSSWKTHTHTHNNNNNNNIAMLNMVGKPLTCMLGKCPISSNVLYVYEESHKLRILFFLGRLVLCWEEIILKISRSSNHLSLSYVDRPLVKFCLRVGAWDKILLFFNCLPVGEIPTEGKLI